MIFSVKAVVGLLDKNLAFWGPTACLYVQSAVYNSVLLIIVLPHHFWASLIQGILYSTPVCFSSGLNVSEYIGQVLDS